MRMRRAKRIALLRAGSCNRKRSPKITENGHRIHSGRGHFSEIIAPADRFHVFRAPLKSGQWVRRGSLKLELARVAGGLLTDTPKNWASGNSNRFFCAHLYTLTTQLCEKKSYARITFFIP